MKYEDKNTRLYRSAFFNTPDLPGLSDVSLWNIAPIWPGREKANLTSERLHALMSNIRRKTAPTGRAVLWMPASELHRTPFDPLDVGMWNAVGTIISGSHPLHIGYVYACACSAHYNTPKLILDDRGKRGSSSSKTMKFVLENLVHTDGPVVEPFAHKSATMPTWARRMGLKYIGYTSSKKTYRQIVKALAQIELPGIQLRFSGLHTKGRNDNGNK